MDQVREAFEPLLDRPAWQVRRGHGSFVRMDFDEPTVEVGEPQLLPVLIEGAPPRAMRRTAHVRRQWHLWIYCCLWSVLLDGTELADSESPDVTINRALRVVNGQALTRVHIQPTNGSTRFVFDLGCVLATYPAAPGSYDDEPVEQWMLYQRQPPGQVLTVRSDGTYQVSGLDEAADNDPWRPLPAAGTGALHGCSDPASLGGTGSWTQLGERNLTGLQQPVLPDGLRFRSSSLRPCDQWCGSRSD